MTLIEKGQPCPTSSGVQLKLGLASLIFSFFLWGGGVCWTSEYRFQEIHVQR